MAYRPVVFDADAEGRIESDSLAFQDFSTTQNARNSLYEPDAEMQNKLGTKAGYLNLENYSGWFDVETATVLDRAWRTMYPRDDYYQNTLNENPDLYGPFWIPSTLIFTLFLSSSLSSSIAAYLAGQHFSYDFTRLSVAVSVVYTYALAVPVLLWAVMRYWAGVDERSAIDLVAIYGYSMTVWIIAAILSIPPVGLARFVFTVLSFSLSLYFLLRNIYPVLSTAQSKAARALVLAIAGLHAVLAMVLWFGFFATADKGFTPIVKPGGGSTVEDPSVPQ